MHKDAESLKHLLKLRSCNPSFLIFINQLQSILKIEIPVPSQVDFSELKLSLKFHNLFQEGNEVILIFLSQNSNPLEQWAWGSLRNRRMNDSAVIRWRQ